MGGKRGFWPRDSCKITKVMYQLFFTPLPLVAHLETKLFENMCEQDVQISNFLN